MQCFLFGHRFTTRTHKHTFVLFKPKTFPNERTSKPPTTPNDPISSVCVCLSSSHVYFGWGWTDNANNRFRLYILIQNYRTLCSRFNWTGSGLWGANVGNRLSSATIPMQNGIVERLQIFCGKDTRLIWFGCLCTTWNQMRGKCRSLRRASCALA